MPGTKKTNELLYLGFQILALEIGLEPSQITELAEKITITIRTLTEIQTIIDSTKGDLALANSLKGKQCLMSSNIY